MSERLERLIPKLPSIAAVVAWDFSNGQMDELTIDLAKRAGEIKDISWQFDFIQIIADLDPENFPIDYVSDPDLIRVMFEMLDSVDELEG